MSSRSLRFASARPPPQRSEPTGPLTAGRLLPAENFVTFAIENAEANRLWRPGGNRSGDDRGGHVGGANLVLPQYQRPGIGGRAYELNSELLRRGNATR